MKNCIVLFMLLAFASSCNNIAKNETKDSEVIKKVEISISGMSCTGCEETITKGALALEGVKDVSASYKVGKAWVTYESDLATTEQIAASIEKSGYKVTGINAFLEPDSIQIQQD